MRWHCPKVTKRKRQARMISTLSLGDPTSKRRLPKATEAFSKLYYTTRILPIVNQRSSSHTGALITLIGEVTKELYAAAVNSQEKEVIDAVEAYIAKEKEARNAQDEGNAKERMPQEYQE